MHSYPPRQPNADICRWRSRSENIFLSSGDHEERGGRQKAALQRRHGITTHLAGTFAAGAGFLPIALFSVVRGSSGVHFHLINPETGHRIRMVSMDAETDKEVSRQDLVKGYEFEKDRYVLLDDDDFEQARIESSSTLTINKFVEADRSIRSISIRPITSPRMARPVRTCSSCCATRSANRPPPRCPAW